MPGELNSWKEIAGHLHVTVRTAQLWEKARALPVRRRPGGRVFALADELDAWKNSMAPNRIAADSGEEEHSGAPPHPSTPLWRRPWFWGSAVLAVILSSSGYYVVRESNGYPADWKVEGNDLIVTTPSGSELFRFAIEGEVLPQGYDKRTRHSRSMCIIADVSGSPRPEVLFNSLSLQDNLQRGELLCFGRSENPLWRFRPGRPGLRNPHQPFGPDYTVASFHAANFGGKTGGAVLAVSFNSVDYPTQVALLRPDNGKILREYWHSGYIGGWNASGDNQLGIFDVNLDGRPEICLAGVANGYDQLPTLVVLDADTMTGTSVEAAGEHQFEGMEPGREVVRIVFPAGCLGQARQMCATGPSPNGHGQLSVRVDFQPRDGAGGPSVRYILNSRFEIVDILFDSTYLTEHDRRFQERVLDHLFDAAAERKRLRQVKRIGN